MSHENENGFDIFAAIRATEIPVEDPDLLDVAEEGEVLLGTMSDDMVRLHIICLRQTDVAKAIRRDIFQLLTDHYDTQVVGQRPEVCAASLLKFNEQTALLTKIEKRLELVSLSMNLFLMLCWPEAEQYYRLRVRRGYRVVGIKKSDEDDQDDQDVHPFGILMPLVDGSARPDASLN